MFFHLFLELYSNSDHVLFFFNLRYELLSEQCQEYASALVNETRTTEELRIILNYDHQNPHENININMEKNTLSRLKLAVRFKQKKVQNSITIFIISIEKYTYFPF